MNDNKTRRCQHVTGWIWNDWDLDRLWPKTFQALVLPILTMPHLWHGIKCFFNIHLRLCLEPRDCENVGPQVISHMCL